jgi:hypothetical protein
MTNELKDTTMFLAKVFAAFARLSSRRAYNWQPALGATNPQTYSTLLPHVYS